MKIETFPLVFILAFSFAFSVAGYGQSTEGLKEGDLLFQDLDCGELCNAIEAVTEGVNGKDFSHCAIVVGFNDTLKVVEAIGSQVQITTLRNFFARSGDTINVSNIMIGRVKAEYEVIISEAVSGAKEVVGQPYDQEFIMNNGKWYCSELIYEIFKEANNKKAFFELNPMTFKDPNTQEFFPAWINYYNRLEKEIPEGKPGINPGLISRSTKIEIVQIRNLNIN